jgi:hypothetical protein
LSHHIRTPAAAPTFAPLTKIIPNHLILLDY